MMSEIRNFRPMDDDEGKPMELDRTTRLALDRTLLAHERTLMAWIRTSASLISFGFTIYKFFEYFVTESGVAARRHTLIGPRHFGMGMIIVGVVALVLATFEYHHEMNVSQAEYGYLRRSSVGKVAGLVSVLGVGLFIVLWLNI